MRGLGAITRRELAGLFYSPLAWVLLAVVLQLDAWVLITVLDETRGDVDRSLSFLLGGSLTFWAVLVFVPPLVTMRMISEEARAGLLEYLMTAPVSDAAVVGGKFLAATFFVSLAWIAVPFHGLVLAWMGAAPDWGPLLGGVCGAILTTGLFCALGLFASALTSTPLLAAFLAFVLNVALLLAPLLGRLVRHPWVDYAIGSVDVVSHFQRSFLIGVLDSAQVVFFASWSALFLFLAARLVEAKRWR